MRNNISVSGIYCIENTQTNKKYVGQSVNIKERWRKHINELNRNIHYNEHLQQAWNEYGETNFKFCVLEYCSIEILDDKEAFYIQHFNTMNQQYGYNLQSGGKHYDHVSDGVRNKMSASIKASYQNSDLKQIRSLDAKNQWANPKVKQKILGENNGMYGKTHTKEAKQKISQANKGKISHKRNTTPVLCVELNKVFKDATTASKELSLDSSAILKVCRKERKTCGGYKWEFVYKENNIS